MIIFKYLRFKNFLSTGNTFTEIQLNRTSTTLVIGQNGAGKSTMLDALCFALFNKAFRNINKPQLVNSVNGKHLVVEVEFDIGSRTYLVRRGIKPSIFEIYVDEKLIQQDGKSYDYQDFLEKNVLKLNYNSFTQIVVLGSSSFVPFMQLKSNARREVIEDLLDIRIFTIMNVLLKDRTSLIKKEIANITSDVNLLDEKIKVRKSYIESLKQDKQTTMQQLQQSINELQQQIQHCNQQIDQHQHRVEKLSVKTDVKASVNTQLRQLEQRISALNSTLKQHTKNVKFFSETETCPTCTQTITEDKRTTAIENLNLEIQTLDQQISSVRDKVVEGEQVIEKIEFFEHQIYQLQQQISKLQKEVYSHQNLISSHEQKIAQMQTETSDVTREQQTLDQLKQQKKQQAEQGVEKTKLLTVHNTASSLLKDSGIKTVIINQYIPIINAHVNKYLQAMGFFVGFTLDDNFNESIKSRYRDDFSYANFSEGEKQKIDMALMLTWRAVAKLKNSTNTNLLVLDEIFDSSLDGESVDSLMRIFQTMGDSVNTFVISHREHADDKFNRTLKCSKQGNFSKMEEL